MTLPPDSLSVPAASGLPAAPDALLDSLADAVPRALPALRQSVLVQPDSGGLGGMAGALPRGGIWDRVVDGVDGVTLLGRELSADVVLTVLVVFALWAVRAVVLFGVRRRTPDPGLLYRWRKGTTYVAVVVGALLLLRVWVGALGSFATFLGLLTAGVAIALRDPLVNAVAWFYILWRRPLSPGDRVTVRQHTGDVIDQRVFQFTLLEVGTSTGADQSTGRIVHVPNGWVFSDSVVNHTSAFAFVWHEVAVTVTFESDWRAAKKALLEIAHECADHLSEDAERTLRRAAREYFIFYSKLTPTVYTSVVKRGVELTVRYLVAPRRVRGSEQDVWEAVLDRFAQHDTIQLAYPTTRIFRVPEEGKSGVGGPAPGEAPQTDGRVYG